MVFSRILITPTADLRMNKDEHILQELLTPESRKTICFHLPFVLFHFCLFLSKVFFLVVKLVAAKDFLK